MSKITRSIMSIMQENAGDNDITTIDGIYEVASSALFTEDGLQLINQENQKNFVVSFVLHYFRDEIGLETLPLWKLALLEKLVSYGTYINEIYEALNKQIFSNYRVRNVANAGSSSGSKNSVGSANTTKNATNTDSGSTNRTYEELSSDSKESNISDNLERKGSEVQLNAGSDSITDNGYNDNMSSKGSSSFVNSFSANFDTPVDELVDIREGKDDNGSYVEEVGIVDEKSYEPPTPTPTPTPTEAYGRDLDVYGMMPDTEHGRVIPGFNYSNTQKYNYLNGGGETDQTTNNIENGNEKNVNHSESTTQHGHKVRMAYGITGEVNGQQQEITDPRIDERSIENLESGSSEKGGTDNTISANTNTINDVTNSSNLNSDLTSDTHEDTTDETSYELSMELVLKSEPYLYKIWNIMDDLFINFSY